MFKKYSHEVQSFGLWHVLILSPEWIQNVNKSAQMFIVCQFIIEKSAKKPANFHVNMSFFVLIL